MQGKLIYLLEDDTDLAALIRASLIMHGCNVTGIATVEAFQQQIAVKLPDLCIIDISLPDGNGIELSAALSAAAFTSQIPVLLMSGHNIKPRHYRQAGAWAFIQKPFAMDAFLETVQQLL